MSHIPAGRARRRTGESTSLSASPHSLGRLWNTASSSLLLNIQARAEQFEAGKSQKGSSKGKPSLTLLLSIVKQVAV